MIKIFLIKEGIRMEFREIVTFFLQAAKLQSFFKSRQAAGILSGSCHHSDQAAGTGAGSPSL